MRVYLYERQLEMPGGNTYFPLATGLLVSYAKKFLKDWTFKINEDPVDPDVAAFSVSLWNRRWCISKALDIKTKYPNCKLIFGGPSAGTVDYIEGAQIIIGAGEEQFLEAISGIKSKTIDLDDIPSPYLSGVFDGIQGTQAIIETNRGCPFSCAYCFWGKGSNKVRFHSMDYVTAEAEWIGAHKIPYVFCADGNFGMFKRDIQIAEIYASVKRRYGYPEKFRVCYGKNAADTIFQTVSILEKAGLSKSVTLSPQSKNQETLKLIGRKNISDTFFDEMQERYADAGIPVYSELIIGLPGETYGSFKSGLVETMRLGNQLFVYLCECLPGTRLADAGYMQANGIKVASVPITPVHCRGLVPEEFEDIVIETASMPIDEWKKTVVLSWMVQLFYSFKLLDLLPQDIVDFCVDKIEEGGEIVGYFKRKADGIASGQGRCDMINGIYFEPEEVMYLRHFSSGVDPVQEVIHARKNNFKKREVVCS